MNLTEQSKEDITDMITESRDVEEDDLTTAYLKGYADAEEKYRKKIKELEVLEDDLKDKRVVYIDTPEFAENYIPKQKVKDYLKEEKERYEVYKKESETNETLKLGMWKHLGAKNMCEKILGIEKNIATLD